VLFSTGLKRVSTQFLQCAVALHVKCVEHIVTHINLLLNQVNWLRNVVCNLKQKLSCPIIPLHVLPSLSMVYPFRQLHEKLPTVFVQLWAQPPLFVVHSLISTCRNTTGNKAIVNLGQRQSDRRSAFLGAVLWCLSWWLSCDPTVMSTSGLCGFLFQSLRWVRKSWITSWKATTKHYRRNNIRSYLCRLHRYCLGCIQSDSCSRNFRRCLYSSQHSLRCLCCTRWYLQVQTLLATRHSYTYDNSNHGTLFSIDGSCLLRSYHPTSTSASSMCCVLS